MKRSSTLTVRMLLDVCLGLGCPRRATADAKSPPSRKGKAKSRRARGRRATVRRPYSEAR